MRLLKQILLIVVVVFVIREEVAGSSVVIEIRVEATRLNNDSIGRPLPLAAHWKVDSYGLSPDDQLDMIEAGHHILPTFGLPLPGLLYQNNGIQSSA